MLKSAYSLIHETNHYYKSCEAWGNIDPDDKDWDTFKEHFQDKAVCLKSCTAGDLEYADRATEDMATKKGQTTLFQ